MFFIKSYTQTFMTQYSICFNKSFQLSGNKTQSTRHLILCKQRLCNIKKFIKLTLHSTQNRQKIQKAQKDKKTGFTKESVENADLLL